VGHYGNHQEHTGCECEKQHWAPQGESAVTSRIVSKGSPSNQAPDRDVRDTNEEQQSPKRNAINGGVVEE
jgi:hypothetical protein